MKFLSIKEAVQNYKTSRATITRLAKKHEQTENVKKEKGKYFILDSFLNTHFLKMSNSNTQLLKTSNSDKSQKQFSKGKKENDLESGKIGSELVNSLKSQNEFLQSQIISKDVQLSKMDSQLVEKDNQINKLLQRQYEQNSIIQTMQNRFESLQNGIDNGVKILSENVKEQKPVTYTVTENEKGNDNGFTIASAVMIILLVLMIVIYLTVK